MSDGTLLSIEGMSAGYDEAAVVRGLDISVAAGRDRRAARRQRRRQDHDAARDLGSRASDGGPDPSTTACDLERMSPSARARDGIAHVPEGRGIFFGLTVAEHFRLGHRGETLDADAAYGYFPALAELKERRAGLLSGGEQQMLAVGRALARHPKLLLLDELSLGLAPVIVERLLPVVRDYARESGCGVLLVEQHVQLALTIADRGYVLSHGEIIMHDKAEALRANRQLLVASYLGEQEVEAT